MLEAGYNPGRQIRKGKTKMNITLKIAQETAIKTGYGCYKAAATLADNACEIVVDRNYRDGDYVFSLETIIISGANKKVSDYAAMGLTVTPDCDIAAVFKAVEAAAAEKQAREDAEKQAAEARARYPKTLHCDPVIADLRNKGFEVSTQTEEEFVACPEATLKAKKDGITVKFYIDSRRNGGSDYRPTYEAIYKCESYSMGDDNKKWCKTTKKLVANIEALHADLMAIEARRLEKLARENSTKTLVQTEIAPDFKEITKWSNGYGRGCGVEHKEYETKRNEKSINLSNVSANNKTATMSLCNITFDQISQIMAILDNK